MSRVELAVRLIGAADQAEVVPLPHGADLPATLRSAGWHDPRYVEAYRPEGRPDDLVITVEATPGPREPAPEPVAAPQDPGLVVESGEIAVAHQRIAAYAVVVEDGAVLLTQLSERVHLVPGWWNLPGGGVDPGEDPVAGLVREVWEETDQRLEPGPLVDVHTQHWLGRAPSGALEDFQAVRLIYSGHVADPHQPVIHDVGGSTAQARWVPRVEIEELPVVATVRLMREDGRL